VRDKLGML